MRIKLKSETSEIVATDEGWETEDLVLLKTLQMTESLAHDMNYYPGDAAWYAHIAEQHGFEIVEVEDRPVVDPNVVY